MNILKKLKSALWTFLSAFGVGILGASKSRQAKYGSNSLVSLIAVIGILVLINLMVKNQNWRYDTTKNQSNSISKESIKVIKDIKKPVK
ncbi:MAG: GldG family protein, partial [bacterium]|nr:GldG family protein [bacterium]